MNSSLTAHISVFPEEIQTSGLFSLSDTHTHTHTRSPQTIQTSGPSNTHMHKHWDVHTHSTSTEDEKHLPTPTHSYRQIQWPSTSVCSGTSTIVILIWLRSSINSWVCSYASYVRRKCRHPRCRLHTSGCLCLSDFHHTDTQRFSENWSVEKSQERNLPTSTQLAEVHRRKKKKKEAEIRNESLTFLLSFIRRKHPSCEVVGGSAGRHFIFTERSETRRSDNLLVSAVQKKTRKTTFIRRVESIYHRSWSYKRHSDPTEAHEQARLNQNQTV